MNTELTIAHQDAALVETLTADLVVTWLAHEADQNEAAPATVRTYRRAFGHFVAWLEENGLSLTAVTPPDVVRFKVAQRGQHSAHTTNLRLTAVRRFYAWAFETGRALANPAQVRGCKRPNGKGHQRDALTNGEVRRLLATPDIDTGSGLRDQAIVTLMAYCGLRSIEVHRANIGDLRTRGDRLTLDVQGKGRTSADEFVVIPAQAEGAVRAWLTVRKQVRKHGTDVGDPLFISLSNRSKGKRISLRAIRQQVKDLFGLAGVAGERKSTHSLRHSFITNAIRKGATPMQVQSAARHQSYDTTLGYYHEVSRIDAPAEDLIDYGTEGEALTEP